MKPGLWEARLLKMTVDGRDETPQMNALHEEARKQARQTLAQMTPEKRKETEAIYRMISGQSDDPIYLRTCVSAEMSKNDAAMFPVYDSDDRTKAKVSRNGNHVTFEMSCQHGVYANNTFKNEVEITSSDLVTVKSEWQYISGGKPQTSVMETQMKFLGSDCGDLKPPDRANTQAQSGASAPSAADKK